ncbi:MAG: protein TolR [Thalassobaculales bacterium]
MAGPLLEPGAAEEGRPLSEINVTPFVDVMLVLLIVFMVAAPLMTVGVAVSLPKTSAPRQPHPPSPVVLSIDAEGRLFVDKEPLAMAEAPARLAALHGENPGRIVLVRGDRALRYAQVMEVMGLVSRAGFAKVSLIAEGAPTGGAAPAAVPR